MIGTFLTPRRRAIIRDIYGVRAPAVEAFLAGFSLPRGQSDPMLADLYANAEPPRQATIDFFARQGVPADALASDADGGGVALSEAMVLIDGDRFDFSDPPHDNAATRAIIVVARGEGGEPTDLVAWQPRTNAVATTRSRAALIGAHELGEPHFADPLMVHKGVLAWLQAGRRGVVVLDASRAWRLLDGELLGAADLDHGIELRRALQPPPPRVVIPSAREAA